MRVLLELAVLMQQQARSSPIACSTHDFEDVRTPNASPGTIRQLHRTWKLSTVSWSFLLLMRFPRNLTTRLDCTFQRGVDKLDSLSLAAAQERVRETHHDERGSEGWSIRGTLVPRCKTISPQRGLSSAGNSSAFTFYSGSDRLPAC